MIHDWFISQKEAINNNVERMKQYIDKPTRITKESRTMIDLIFANKRDANNTWI